MEAVFNPIESRGKLLESYERASIYEGFPYNFYEKKIQKFEGKEKIIFSLLKDTILRKFSMKELTQELNVSDSYNFMDDFNRNIVQTIEINELLSRYPDPSIYQTVLTNLVALFEKYFSGIKNKELLADEILSKSIGYGELSTLLEDEQLEEVMVNGLNRYVFVFHKKYGMCKTNLLIRSNKLLQSLISKIANTVGKRFDEQNPLLDARLPDGSRANATFSNVTPFGHSLTIRKFTKTPLSIIDLIMNNTLSSEISAFLWLVVEGLNIEPLNLIITGGAGSGKTTLMNALSNFVRMNERVITIEDTIELDLGVRENWIQMESRPKIRESEEVTMDDLLKNALRMRPDRLLVGEVRGIEAQTLFVAMDTGHRGILGTMHSNTAREMIVRLKSPPMNVPDSMLPLLNLSIVMFRMYDKDKGMIRRVREVAELERMEKKILLSNIYEWDRDTDSVVRTDVPMRTLDRLSEKTGFTKKELKNELFIRQRILEWMIENNIIRNEEVTTIIQTYYQNPAKIIDQLSH